MANIILQQMTKEDHGSRELHEVVAHL